MGIFDRLKKSFTKEPKELVFDNDEEFKKLRSIEQDVDEKTYAYKTQLAEMFSRTTKQMRENPNYKDFIIKVVNRLNTFDKNGLMKKYFKKDTTMQYADINGFSYLVFTNKNNTTKVFYLVDKYLVLDVKSGNYFIVELETSKQEFVNRLTNTIIVEDKDKEQFKELLTKAYLFNKK